MKNHIRDQNTNIKSCNYHDKDGKKIRNNQSQKSDIKNYAININQQIS